MVCRFVALVLVGWPGVGAAADPPPVWEYTVTHAGRPVAGAKVGLTPYTYPTPGDPKPGPVIFATSDAKGEFRLPRPADTGFARVLARDAAGRGGYGSLFSNMRHPATLELHTNGELTGRVTDAAGKPVPGLTLTPIALGPENFARYSGYGGKPLVIADTPAWFWEPFPVRIAADGAFTLCGVPFGHPVQVRFAAPGYGAGKFWALPNKPTVVTLAKAGAVAVRVAGADPRPVTVKLTRQPDAGAPTPLEATAEGTVPAGGELVLPGVPPGTYQVLFPAAEPAATFPKPVPTVVMTAGERAVVATTFEPAARVTAKFVDSKTGQGVAGAKPEVRVGAGDRQFAAVFHPTTGPGGMVDSRVLAGPVTLTPTAAEGYAVVQFTTDPFNRHTTQTVPVGAGRTHDFGRFALVKTVAVVGRVVDPDGTPVAGAAVSIGYSGTNFYSGKPVVSGADGEFTAAGLNPEGGLVGITARKGAAITAAPVAVDPGKPVGDLKVVISDRFAARLTLRAVDRAGKPIAGAAIDLTHSVRYLASSGGIGGSGGGRKVGATGSDGRFTSDVLQPGDRYGVTITVPGFRPFTIDEAELKPGETKDGGDLRLTRADVAVTGTVTDRAGKPVTGATVFSSADGPRPAATTTDPAGRFTLGGLYEGPAFVSVKADGFRLASVSAEPGGPPLTVALARPSDPPSPPPVIGDDHRKAMADLARHLLEAMWAARVQAKDDGKEIVAAMARLDLPTARKWAAEEQARAGGTPDLAAVIDRTGGGRGLVAIAADDPDEVITLLKLATGLAGFREVCQLARELTPTAPDKALRLAEEAVARSRGMDQGSRAWALATAGELVYRAGNTAAGKKLIEEAAGSIGPLSADGLGGHMRGTVAVRLALCDPAAARKIIDGIKDNREFNRYLSQACIRLAETDLPLAKAWLADLRTDNSFAGVTARQNMAYRLARTNPDESVALADGIADKTNRALALAGVAARLTDRGRAARVIDDALDRIVADPSGYYTNNGGGGGTAALVLYRAKQAGHPDLAGARDKVLAARSTADDGPWRNHNAGVQTALALALTDPATAKVLLDRALPPADRPKLDWSRNREALTALALADPAAAREPLLAAVKLAAAAGQGFRYGGVDGVAQLLADPDRRATLAARSAGLVWDFEEE